MRLALPAVALVILLAGTVLPAPLASNFSATSTGVDGARDMAGPPEEAIPDDLLASLPEATTAVTFEPNRGQGPSDALFIGRIGGITIELLRNAIRIPGPEGPVGVRFAGALHTATLEGQDQRSSYTSYFTEDATISGVPHYGAVLYRGLYPGIDVRFYPTPDGGMEFDYLVAPLADPSVIRIEPLGPHLTLTVTPTGELDVGQGFYLHAPIVFQEGSQIDGKYVLDAFGRATFQLGAYDRLKPLIIDPKLGFSTYFGGDGSEMFTAAKGFGGHLYVAGMSKSTVGLCTASPSASSPAPPSTCPTAYGAGLAAADASTMVAKFDLTQDGYPSLVWIARIQGILYVWDIDVDGSGVYLTGSAGSGLPLTSNAYQAVHGSTPNTVYLPANGCSSTHDAFLVRMSLTGMDLLYASYLGGQFQDYGYGVTAAGGGHAVVVGAAQWTNGAPFPTVNGFQMSHNGPQASYFCLKGTLQGCFDAFVAKFDTTAPLSLAGFNTDSLLFSTLAGAGPNPGGTCTVPNGSGFPSGSGNDIATDVAIDGAGTIWVSGYTSASADSVPPFPSVAGAYQAVPGGAEDAFVLQIDPSGETLLYSTFLGGSAMDRAYGIAIGNGKAYITGVTASANLPTNGPAYRTSSYGGSGTALQDAFVASFDLATGQLVKSTYLGSPSESNGMGPPGCGSQCSPVYMGNEMGNSIQVDPAGKVHIQGVTDHASEGVGPHFPTLHVWPGLASKQQDLFVASFTEDLGELLFASAVGSIAPDLPIDCFATYCSSPQYGFPASTSYPSPGRYGTLVTDALGTNPVVVGSMSWPSWANLDSFWDLSDGRGPFEAPKTQQYRVARWIIQPTPCPPPTPWGDPCFQWPADGHLQFNITHTSTDLMGNTNSFTKPLHLVRCGASFNGGMPITQAMTPNPPNPAPWPLPTIRMRWGWDNNCISAAGVFNSCCDYSTDSYPTAGGFPINRSASNINIELPDLNSFHRDHFSKGIVSPPGYCCSRPPPFPSDATIARFVGPSEPYVVCGVTSSPPYHRGFPISFTWAPPGVPHTQSVETYSPYDLPLDPDWGLDIASFRWDFAYDGTFDPVPAANGAVTPSYAYPLHLAAGTYTVMVKVKDTDGVEGTGTCKVEIGNAIPVADCTATGAYALAAGLPIQFSPASSMDPDGTIEAYQWTFPGGDPASSTEPTPTVMWSDAGMYDVTLVVTDNDGADSLPFTCTLEVEQNPARPDVYVFNEDQGPTELHVTANDMGAFPMIAYTWPSKGTLSGPVDEVFTYQPWPDATGTDSFTYLLQGPDGLQFIGLVTLDINAVNDPPIFSVAGLAVATAPENGPHVQAGWAHLVGPGPWSATDEAGQSISFVLDSNSNPGIFAGTPELVRTATAASTVAADPATAGEYAMLRFAPSGLHGNATLCFRALDDGGAATVTNTWGEEATGEPLGAPVCFNVVENGPPVAYFEAQTESAAPGAPILFDSCPRELPYCTHDPDGAIASYKWDFGDGYTSDFLAPTHVFATPGEYTVRLTVKDTWGSTATYLRVIQVAWQDRTAPEETGGAGGVLAPVADAGANRTVPEGRFIQLAGSQAGGHTVSYQWLQVAGIPVELANATTPFPSFVAPVLPGGVPVDLVFRLLVREGEATSAPAFVVIRVVSGNHAPVAEAGPSQTVRVGEAVVLDATGSIDPDGDELSFEWQLVEGPAIQLTGAASASASFVASVPGELRFRLRAFDGHAAGYDETIVRVEAAQGLPPLGILHTLTFDAQGAVASLRAAGTDTATWDFGDGSPPEPGASVTHRFEPGTYTVTVHSEDGRSHTEQLVIPATHTVSAEAGFAWLPVVGSFVAFLAAAVAVVFLLLRRKDS